MLKVWNVNEIDIDFSLDNLEFSKKWSCLKMNINIKSKVIELGLVVRNKRS